LVATVLLDHPVWDAVTAAEAYRLYLAGQQKQVQLCR